MPNLGENIFKNIFKNQIDKAVKEQIVSEDIEKRKKTTDEYGQNGELVFSGWINPNSYSAERALEKPALKGVNFETLRAFTNYYPVARSCVNYRKSQILKLDWDITLKDEKKLRNKGEYKVDPEVLKRSQKVVDFFSHPTGGKEITFRHFLSQSLEDILILDALALYRRKTRDDSMYGYLPIDAGTIKLRINQDGTVPQSPDIAYKQYVNGKFITDLTTDEMFYKIMNPRTTTPYGLSPVESLIITISTALKLQSYNLSYLSEGNVPEGFLSVPKDIASTPKQITEWQRMWDGMLGGDPRMQRKLRIIPEGTKYEASKKAEDMTFERFEKWLLTNTCTVFAVEPKDIGFNFDPGRTNASTNPQELGNEKGMQPLCFFLKEIFDEIIQVDLKESDLEFVWTSMNPTQSSKEAQVFQTLVDTGAVSVDEWRISQGKQPIGLGHYIKTAQGVILVKDFLEGKLFGQNVGQANVPGAKPANAGASGMPQMASAPKVGQPTAKPTIPTNNRQVSQGNNPVKKVMDDVMALDEDATEDIRKWKKVAVHDLENGIPFREFDSTKIDLRTKEFIKQGLGEVKTNKDISELFEPFLSPETKVTKALLGLYGDLKKVIGD